MKRILVLVCMVLFLGSFVSAEYSTAADRFVNNNDGTVTDTQTGFMWADHDNGSNFTWLDAKSYCEGYSGGGKPGWRMPTLDELQQLYNSGAYGSVIKKTGLYIWSSATQLSPVTGYYEAGIFDTSLNHSRFILQSVFNHCRALPVRSGK